MGDAEETCAPPPSGSRSDRRQTMCVFGGARAASLCKNHCVYCFSSSVWTRPWEITREKQLLVRLEAAWIKGVQKSKESLFSLSLETGIFWCCCLYLHAHNDAVRFPRTCHLVSRQKKKGLQMLHCFMGKEQMGKVFSAGFCL